MEKHILWKIKHWFPIAFVKLTILEVWIKLISVQIGKIKTLGTRNIIILKQFLVLLTESPKRTEEFPMLHLEKRILTTQLCLKHVLHWLIRCPFMAIFIICSYKNLASWLLISTEAQSAHT